MRTLFLFFILTMSVAVKAQMGFTPGFMDYGQRGMFGNNNYSVANPGNKKWFVSSYSSISSSYSFFKGGQATVLSAPIGLQLNRRLSNNWYAFAGVSAAPAYMNFSGPSFVSPFGNNKSYQSNGIFNANNFGMYGRAELGLMFVNEAKTFSFSGSISVQRSSYPMFPYQQTNAPRSNLHVAPNN